ncbi:MAG: hydrogenase iron-sulfur subunit [Deltaproteobacteria bacterium]|jgi:coenzyme F420-reducing hydrogenase delta subunit|nr:hydrogenase iron-sulfur subunit [Deltaproteobacteria bacterium]
MPGRDFAPKVIAFCCQYCAYSAADMAGSMRLQYPAEVEIVLIPCTGRFDVILALRAFEKGADGVYVAGCLEGNCHFLDGNIRARKRVDYLKEGLASVGVEPGRVRMYNLSASQGPRFAEIAGEFVRDVASLGPFRDAGPLGGPDDGTGPEGTDGKMTTQSQQARGTPAGTGRETP